MHIIFFVLLFLLLSMIVVVLFVDYCIGVCLNCLDYSESLENVCKLLFIQLQGEWHIYKLPTILVYV